MNKNILHWSYRDFKTIPEELLQYDEFLEEIYLKENFITIIPQWLFQLTNLKFIHLSGNCIFEIPNEIFLLENLEFLDISNNKLKSLPNTIGKLKKLERLIMYGNDIRKIPKNIGEMESLQTLDLSANQIRSLPLEIGDCTQLYEIILNDNVYLEILPSTLTRLTKLDTLCAERCGLLYLPPNLPLSITHVRIFNNKFITHIPLAYKRFIRSYFDILHQTKENILSNRKTFMIEEQESKRYLMLPFETKMIHFPKQQQVFSLYDTCLKLVQKFYTKDEIFNNLPKTINENIKNGPAALCALCLCQKPIYTEYYFLIVKRKNSSSNLIFSGLFCSLGCATLWFEINREHYYRVFWKIL